jgi:hypothetical protein
MPLIHHDKLVWIEMTIVPVTMVTSMICQDKLVWMVLLIDTSGGLSGQTHLDESQDCGTLWGTTHFDDHPDMLIVCTRMLDHSVPW